MGENGDAAAGAAPAPRLPPGTRLGKDVSVGEYDSATGLTYVTRQRGRLHFNMGANAIKQAHAAATEAAAAARARSEAAGAGQEDAGHGNTTGTLHEQVGKLLAPHLRTGMFTGLALYPEEAYYLLQRGALAIYKLEQPSSNGIRAVAAGEIGDGQQELQPLSAVHFVALLLGNQRASLACLDVYVFLKENKFHPRRHQEETVASPSSSASLAAEAATAMLPHSQPQHYNSTSASADSSCRFAYDVWKSSTETVYIPNEDHKPTDNIDVEGDVKAAISEKAADPYGGNAEELRSHEAEEPAPPVKPSSLPPSAPSAATATPSTTTTTAYVKRKKNTSVKKRKVKRLRLAFRVLVCRFADAMPQPRDLAALAATSGSHAPPEAASHVPVKVAVVDQDKSVLFFEVGG